MLLVALVGEYRLYTENITKDIIQCLKAILSNQIARFAPKLYVKLTDQTGRGSGDEDAQQIAKYFLTCFDDYRHQFDLSNDDLPSFLNNKCILEYGPGDVLGVALLFYAHGAKSVHCVDRFPLSNLSAKNICVYQLLLEALKGPERIRAEGAFNVSGDPASGLNAGVISYKVTKSGLSGELQKYDLVLSRAVLEHVNDLSSTFKDIKRATKSNGLSIHQVDLRSHGLDRYKALDFLTWPSFLYNLMYSHKGFPNRWRVNTYRGLAEDEGLNIIKLEPIGFFELDSINEIKNDLSQDFVGTPLEELNWKGFWLQLSMK